MAVGATAIWRVRPSGSNTNGGGYDPGISGAATDYSQQDAAQATGSHGTATGTTNFADTVAAAFTSAMVGNAIWIASGAGFTPGAYFVTAFVNASNVTLDRSPGTGTVAAWALGGGWADFWTNTTSSGPVVAGNTVYILGSGTPNPSSYTYDYTLTTNVNLVSGNVSGFGVVAFANDPSTPGYKAPPDTTGGMPVVRLNGNKSVFITTTKDKWLGIWFVANALVATNTILTDGNSQGFSFGCVFDQFGSDCICLSAFSDVGSEFFSSVVPGSAGSSFALFVASNQLTGTNIHDTVGPGMRLGGNGQIVNCIIAKCGANGISFNGATSVIFNCTIDGNVGHGIDGTFSILQNFVFNNIISNHTGVGKYGIYDGGQTAGTKSQFIDYNVYYNNTTDIGPGLIYGPHDTHGGSNPYVGQSTENYTLA